ncbi:DNA-processing protein DprA [Campylobacter devanensis]|uniref:DNA-processing protein DprA n=1 Tax=Campylobacter devanensis TaxID=3161138 RepID=UPI000A33534A|nr:DNA-processing protein DprA [Campylobacter sp. P0134]
MIASGLAFICDGIAHRAAFKFNMLTITILPSRIKEIIPKQNTDLANQISINGGLIISKYYKDALNFKEQMSGCV